MTTSQVDQGLESPYTERTLSVVTESAILDLVFTYYKIDSGVEMVHNVAFLLR